MDASTRWETAAIRSKSGGGRRPPVPSARRGGPATTWVTLKEAEAATSVPVNTLRKWVRRADLPSYLESDGDVSLRMVDLDAVVSRARKLGRHVEPLRQSEGDERDEIRSDGRATTTPESIARTERENDTSIAKDDIGAEGTMIVPIDAFNKMLSQLGNLHEAGQQLAEARERAAKAETEATFLRQRLAELRTERLAELRTERLADLRTEESAELRSRPAVADEPQEHEPTSEGGGPSATPKGVENEPRPVAAPDQETTTYWRYLSTSWTKRRRRRRMKAQ